MTNLPEISIRRLALIAKSGPDNESIMLFEYNSLLVIKICLYFIMPVIEITVGFRTLSGHGRCWCYSIDHRLVFRIDKN